MACFGTCVAHRAAAFVDRAAAGSLAFIRRAFGIARYHAHPRQCDVELFGGDLRHGGDDALADFHLAGADSHGAVRIEAQPLIESAVGVEAAGQLGGRAHDAAFAGASSRAARCTALMMRVCVPQRHRLRASACLMSSSVGSGLRPSSAAAVMMTPLMQ